jgi:hypothetical protein
VGSRCWRTCRGILEDPQAQAQQRVGELDLGARHRERDGAGDEALADPCVCAARSAEPDAHTWGTASAGKCSRAMGAHPPERGHSTEVRTCPPLTGPSKAPDTRNNNHKNPRGEEVPCTRIRRRRTVSHHCLHVSCLRLAKAALRSLTRRRTKDRANAPWAASHTACKAASALGARLLVPAIDVKA